MFKPLPAPLAVQAGVSEPLDADTLADLDGGVLGMCANGDDVTDTLRRMIIRGGKNILIKEERSPRDHR